MTDKPTREEAMEAFGRKYAGYGGLGFGVYANAEAAFASFRDFQPYEKLNISENDFVPFEKGYKFGMEQRRQFKAMLKESQDIAFMYVESVDSMANCMWNS